LPELPQLFGKKTDHAMRKWILLASLAVLLAASTGVMLRLLDRGPGFLRHEDDYYRPDTLAGHLHQPNAVREYLWPEHREGLVRLATNNLGFREDAPTLTAKPEGTRRIVVTGDSHIDGVVNNAESVANRIETKLNEGENRKRYEVINAGHGYYTFHNYVGLLRSLELLAPDLFIVIVYAGNDFAEALMQAERDGELKMPRRPSDYRSRLRAATKTTDGQFYAGVGQALNQVAFFKQFPQFEEIALRVAIAKLAELQAEAERQEIDLLVVILPPQVDLEWASDQARNDEAKAELELNEIDLLSGRRLTAELIHWLTRKGIPGTDLHEPLRETRAAMTAAGAKENLFWVQDHHLSTAGQRAVADALLKQHRALFEGR